MKMTGPFAALLALLGRWFFTSLRSTGRTCLLLLRCVIRLPILDRRELLRSLAQFGTRSLGLAVGVAMLTGALVVVQTSLYVERFGARTHLGWAAGYAVIWEFGPLMMGLTLAARLGSRNAAELASLSQGGQIEGLRGISLDPYRLIIAPRVWAIVLTLLFLTPMVLLIAVCFEALAAELTLRLPWRVFAESFADMLTKSDLLGGMIKTGSFGLIIALVSSTVGLHAQGGARAVGRAAASAMVWSCASIFSVDFALTAALSRLSA